ncbi:MAG TPA: PspC domain-containing protein [Fibrobacteraceae bacterium]|jgi:phage shock protein C|nr:PspC domain-containing protein [Fibrobacter sp.]HOG68906.1 PspC domain-containing protein [Fibrobacteraceae bacterium]HPW94821.1 PspC domain-containing protein [Fibrobacteraceae bacterium]
MRKLTLSSTDIKIAGVCAGIAEFLQIDPTIVRIICVCSLLIFGFFTVPAYLLLWFIIPRE